VIVEVVGILLGKAGSRAGCSNLDNISLCLRLVYFSCSYTPYSTLLALINCSSYSLSYLIACIHLVILDW